MRIERFRVTAAVALAMVLAAPAAMAQSSDPTRSNTAAPDDRRFLQIFAYDAAIVENTWLEGQFRIQDSASAYGGGDGDVLRVGPVLAFSPLDKLEIGGRIDFLDVDVPGGDSESGLSDTIVYGKWQFFHNPVQFSVGMELYLPTGDADSLLGTGEFDFAFFGSVRKNLEEAYLTGYFGFRSNNDADVGADVFPGGDRNLNGKTSIMLGGGVMFPMSDRWALSGELQVETERYEDADSMVEITGGAYWYISKGMTLRGGIGFGLDDGSPDWQLIAGMAWHF